MHVRHIVFAVTMAACGVGEQAFASSPQEGPAEDSVLLPEALREAQEESGPDVPYDRAIQKSIHNAYERREPLIDQLLYHHVRSLELDVHVRREGAVAPARDWFVYHEDYPFMRDTLCARFSDCLGQMAAFHRALPRHEAITLFVDLKESFEAGHQPGDLDAALVRALGVENIVTPGDVMRACPGAESVRAAVTGECQFPTLHALRGKFLVVTTGGTACYGRSLVSQYAGSAPSRRLAFVGPNVDASCPVFAYDARPDVVFFNMPFVERRQALDVERRGLVARVYGGGSVGGLDTAGDFAAARATGAHHLATDMVSFEESGWATSHRARGFPFTCVGCGDAAMESGAVLAVRATSGDVEGTSDSAVFAYADDEDDSSWSALVSVPSSHVEPFAKACLVARASEAPDAVNVAVCRPFDENAPRAQIRATSGGTTTVIEASSFEGITDETPAFLRLGVRKVSGSSEVTAWASRDGRSWARIAKATVGGSLPLRGVSVSSHGPVPVKGLFANLVRNANGRAHLLALSDLHLKAVGAGAAGDAFDGTSLR